MSRKQPSGEPMSLLERIHPLTIVIRVIRVWLACLAAVMLWNAFSSNAILLNHEWIHPLPFLLSAGLAVAWIVNVNHDCYSIYLSSGLAVTVALRGVEVLLYGEEVGYNAAARMSGFTVWGMTAVTCVGFGVMNVAALARKRVAESMMANGE